MGVGLGDITGIDRRAFAKLLAAAALGAEFDLDRLLWVPRATVVVPEMPRALRKFVITHIVVDRFGSRMDIAPYERRAEFEVLPRARWTYETKTYRSIDEAPLAVGDVVTFANIYV